MSSKARLLLVPVAQLSAEVARVVVSDLISAAKVTTDPAPPSRPERASAALGPYDWDRTGAETTRSCCWSPAASAARNAFLPSRVARTAGT